MLMDNIIDDTLPAIGYEFVNIETGKPTTILLDRVEQIDPMTDSTTIFYLVSGRHVVVEGSYENVKKLLGVQHMAPTLDDVPIRGIVD